MEFQKFKTAVAEQFGRMCARGHLFIIDIEGEEVWNAYLAAFPEGTNPVFRERTEYDCTCCKKFVRDVGNIVSIIDGKLESVWDITVRDEPNFQVVTDALSALVKSKPIKNMFLTTERTAGVDKTFEQVTGNVRTWNHFFVNIPPKFVLRDDKIGPTLSELRSSHDVLLRGLNEITTDAIDTVLELIEQNSLYRGKEHTFAVSTFLTLKNSFLKLQEHERDMFVWHCIASGAPGSVSRIRNTSIGTLLQDLSAGMDLEEAVKKFEAMVAPANYKRPTALVSKAMIEKARAKIEELGLVSALERRYAKLTDITVNNVLFADRDAKKAMGGDVFDDIAGKVKESSKSLDRVEEVNIDKFLADILPKATSIEVMMANSHVPNLVSLVAPVDPTATGLFKWPNNFSWSYNGNMADSIKERVKAAGGNVTGELCCRLAWEYADDLDFYMEEPGGSTGINFGNRGRLSINGGMLDVDANGLDGIVPNPVENIFYNSMKTMREGVYRLLVNNFNRRSSGVGFEVEIDILGTVYNFVYEKAVKEGEFVEIAKMEYTKAGGLKIVRSMPSSMAVKEVWGISTNTFRRVTSIMLSPNHWDGHGVGNRHFFFMIDGCVNEGSARGFFNEFLNEELNAHRKVLEIVGSRMKTESSADQLSGLGFSSTQRNELLVRVKGSFTRIIKVLF